MLSPYYVDNVSDKTREVDLICETQFRHAPGWGSRIHFLRIQLVVECKYIASPTVFWFDVRDDERLLASLNEKTPFTTGKVRNSQQHYLRAGGLVAKLFASKAALNRKEENDPIYVAISQCLGALVQNPPFITADDGGTPTHTIRYPMVVCQDNAQLFSAHVSDPDGPVTPLDRNFLLETNYAYLRRGNPHREYFLIDVVRLSGLTDFFAALEAERKEAHSILDDARD